MVMIKTGKGTYVRVKSLLDTGASISVIKQSLVNRLKLHQQSNDNTIYGIGHNQVKVPGSTVKMVIKPVGQIVPIISTTAMVMYDLTGKLNAYPSHLKEQIRASNIHLADNDLDQTHDIDIILGTDILNYVLDGSKISTSIPGLSAYGSCFGHVIMGALTSTQQSTVKSSQPTGTSVEDYGVHATRLEEVLERFWKVEEPPSKPAIHPDHLDCERLYDSTTQRMSDGKYMVRLPLLSNRSLLGESKHLAIKRLESLERKMAKDTLFADKYREFMKEYETLGHMTKSNFQFDSEHFIIPHHGIFKRDSDKLRVVFDGSGQSSTGVSLNQCLHTGQPLQNDITQIILNFRRHQVVFTTDIRMMFRQTWIHPEDRKYQLILWREDPSEAIQVYELNTNTYGLRSSPFIAIRTLLRLADDWESSHPESPASQVIRRDTFVDDILTGADTVAEAQQLKLELIELTRSAGYELRKWSSNCRELLQDLPHEHCEQPHLFDMDDKSFIKVLGIQWDPVSDSLSYQINVPLGQPISKRSILSTIARLYDPCGYSTPIIFRFKVFLQSLFTDGLNWDEPINQHQNAQWNELIQDLNHLSHLQIPRCVALPGAVSYSLHGFGDASELGYAASVYLRTVDSSGNVLVRLIIAKSRVAPKKTTQTIPKLELSAAHLVFKLLNHVAESYEDSIQLDSINAWSDSTIVLSWLNTKPHMLQTFECNRVQDIQNSKRHMTWRHIRSELNPADVASRGMSANDLIGFNLWWSPDWLLQDESHWPSLPVTMPHNLPGFKKMVNFITPVESWEDVLLSRVSSYSKLINITSYVLRFCRNIRLPKDQRNRQPVLTLEETRQATKHWIKKIQLDAFKDEIILINKGKLVCKSLQKLSVFIDEEHIIRVGGRLKKSSLPYGARHPYLIPKDHRWGQLLIEYYHKVYCHASTNALIGILRREYWITSVRRQVSKVIRKCLVCFRFKAVTQQPFMADLPADRVTAARPFSGVATDFAGPYLVKSSLLRNAKSVKAYLCIFVCLGTKAVHLELVSSLSTEAFIAAFTRFVSRRGLPSLIRSDRGTNFIGSNSYLRDVNRFLVNNEIILKEEFLRQNIRWEFNPAGAPHMSGLAESAVKSSKNLLKRELGDTILTFEELSTLISKVESILNSRPLVPMSEDPCDLEVLTPGHFLIGQPLVALPEPHWKDTKRSRLSRFQLLQKLHQTIWSRWHIEYLHNLQSRNKWFNHVKNLELNDLVLIIDENSPPLQWRRGRVIELYKNSTDSVVRSVKLRTSYGEVTRPVVKLCKLPME